MENKLRYIDLFAGIGGMRIPLDKRGLQCVFTSEIDSAARMTYSKNFGVDEPEIFGDLFQVESIGPESVPDHELIVAGFPCQPFSQAGKREGFADQARGTLFFSILQIIQAKRPRAVLLENVRGLLSQDKGRSFKIILSSLEEAGYVVSHKVLNARDFGLPQNRQRLFIVALREDVCEKGTAFSFPEPLSSRETLSLGDVLDPYPADDALYISDRIWASHQARRKRNREIGRGFGYQLFTRDSKYAATISARYYKDGSEILIDERDGRNPRKLSSREALRLQGFPEWFAPHSSYAHATKQAGNAVPVPVIDAIAEKLLPLLS
jgi:DNA (cytosine-5)-methyltransferase 1